MKYYKRKMKFPTRFDYTTTCCIFMIAMVCMTSSLGDNNNGTDDDKKVYLLPSINVTCKSSFMSLVFQYNNDSWHRNASLLVLTNNTIARMYPKCADVIVDGGSNATQTMTIDYSSCPITYYRILEANTKFVQLSLDLKTFAYKNFTDRYIDGYDFVAKCYYRINSTISFDITLYNYDPGSNSGYVTAGHSVTVVDDVADHRRSLPLIKTSHLLPPKPVAQRKDSNDIIVSEPLEFPPNTFHGDGDNLDGLTTNLISPPGDLNRNISLSSAYIGQSAVLQIKLETTESYTSIILNQCFFSISPDPFDYTAIFSFVTDGCPDNAINRFAHVVETWDVNSLNTTYMVYYLMPQFERHDSLFLHCVLDFCTSQDTACNPNKSPGCDWKKPT